MGLAQSWKYLSEVFAFEYDLLLIAEDETQANRQLNIVSHWVNYYNLSINAGKSKFITNVNSKIDVCYRGIKL